ncbi:DUF7742 family protein [Shimia thalassica]|uniref:DUF7742 family protein n=1 Tax=Shimia thalassica TaxID=1715693 RepID=UPI0026E16D15|nr:hypothetical protein [Shimia thalassica]MDO6485264.1 hypothetical protein [Shimia thalassica]
MRRVMHGDVVSVARVLLTCAAPLRPQMCRRMIEQSHAAHRFFKRFGRAHPLWGDGSLMALAHRQKMRPEPGFANSEYCTCVELVLSELVTWRSDRQINRARN